MKPPLMASSLQRPLFPSQRTKNPSIDSCGCQQPPLYDDHFLLSPRWPCIVDRFNCIFLQLFQFERWHWKEYLLSFINHNKKQKIFVVLFAMTLTCFGQMTRTLNDTDPVCNMPEKVMLNIHVSNLSWGHRSPQKVLPVLVSGCGQALWGTQTRMFSWLFKVSSVHENFSTLLDFVFFYFWHVSGS